MSPLEITAHVPGPIVLKRPIMLDALLGAAVCVRDGLPPVLTEDATPIDVPIARDPSGRIRLTSASVYETEAPERRHLNRRTDVYEATHLGDAKFKRIQLSTGRNKSYRMPMQIEHLVGGVVTWWCIGDAKEIRALLEHVDHLGVKRSNALGRVERWTVEPWDPMADGPENAWDTENGFPVVRDGVPLRPLPPDWPGVSSSARLGYAVLSMPYWQAARAEMAAVPDAW